VGTASLQRHVQQLQVKLKLWNMNFAIQALNSAKKCSSDGQRKHSSKTETPPYNKNIQGRRYKIETLLVSVVLKHCRIRIGDFLASNSSS
jgi:hypothetical protein